MRRGLEGCPAGESPGWGRRLEPTISLAKPAALPASSPAPGLPLRLEFPWQQARVCTRVSVRTSCALKCVTISSVPAEGENWHQEPLGSCLEILSVFYTPVSHVARILIDQKY